MHRMIFEHLNAKFPGTGEIALQESRKAEGRNGFTNTAVRATGTDYYQYCFGEHLTEDVDLVLIETGKWSGAESRGELTHQRSTT